MTSQQPALFLARTTLAVNARDSDNTGTLEPIKDHLGISDLLAVFLGQPLGNLLPDHISRAVGRARNGLRNGVGKRSVNNEYRVCRFTSLDAHEARHRQKRAFRVECRVRLWVPYQRHCTPSNCGPYR